MKRIGILGGGQLGRMTIEESRKLLSYIEVLSPDYPSPAADLADATHLGDLMDYEAVMEVAREVDVLSYEIEHVNVDALWELERGGMPVIPAAAVLALIQDKGRQKELMDANGIPTAAWAWVDGGHNPATPAGLHQAALSLGGYPVVQKARRGGYDGRGVAVIRNEADARSAGDGGRLLAVPSFVERKVAFDKELAVVVARDQAGREASYPCVEMVFDERANLCDSVLMPARVPPETLASAEAVARSVVDALDSAAKAEAAAEAHPSTGAAGVFGVELFLTADGSILVNEAAPRPHNSGHVSMEACVTSQFEQYYRILAGYPLGSTALVMPGMMVNLLGEPGATGEPDYLGLADALSVPGVSVHLYGKREVRPFRKMGHLTAIAPSADEAMERAERARKALRIMGRA